MKPGRLCVGHIIIPLAYGSLVLLLLVFCEFAVANLMLFQPSPCGRNKAYKHNLLGSPQTAEAVTACSILCQANDECISFTYNHGSRSCNLSTALERTCNQLTAETDSVYYGVVSWSIIFCFLLFR